MGTLGSCDGFCPIDYYIKSLMVEVVTFESRLMLVWGVAVVVGVLVLW